MSFHERTKTPEAGEREVGGKLQNRNKRYRREIHLGNNSKQGGDKMQ